MRVSSKLPGYYWLQKQTTQSNTGYWLHQSYRNKIVAPPGIEPRPEKKQNEIASSFPLIYAHTWRWEDRRWFGFIFSGGRGRFLEATHETRVRGGSKTDDTIAAFAALLLTLRKTLPSVFFHPTPLRSGSRPATPNGSQSLWCNYL